MKFTLWSVWHILYILSPFVLFSVIYFCTRKASEKTKRIVGIVMGALSLVVIIARNVDIYVREGMGVEVIPFQVCHIGSIIVGLALIFKKKWLLLTAFCFNMMPGFLSIVFADSLVNYATLWAIRRKRISGDICLSWSALCTGFSFIKATLTAKTLFILSVSW